MALNFNKISSLLFFSSLIYLFPLCMYAEGWKPVYYSPTITNTFYDIQLDLNYQKNKIIDFPEDLYYTSLIESINSNGLEIIKHEVINDYSLPENFSKTKSYHYLKEFTEPIICKKDTTTFTMLLYLRNAKKYSLYIYTDANKWYHKDFDCLFEGFQYPNQLFLSDLFNATDTLSTKINKILILVQPDDLTKKVIFAANHLTISNKINKETLFTHPFFSKVLHLPDTYSIFEPNFNKCELLYNTYFYTPWSNITFINNEDANDETELIKDLIAGSLESYPFYKERNLNKEVVIQKLRNLYASEKAFANNEDFLIALALFLKKEINDGHFFLKLPFEKKKTVYSPVRLYEIANKVVVSAVFDSGYVSQIPLGSEVLAIDDKKIETWIDSLKIYEYGVEERKRSRSIASLLNREKGDSVILQIKKKNSNEIEKITLHYKNKITIPANFRSTHLSFEKKDSVAYFKINNMDGNVFIHWVNHWEEIINSKGLILDLRGNGGGNPDGELLFSTFIKKPTVYSQIGFKGLQGHKESIVIRPHKTMRIPSDFPVIILGDENTACASEEFIQAMQQLDNCYYLSHIRTAGSLHERFALNFPSGVFLSLDCLSEKIYSIDGRILECSGIEPDIWLQYNQIEDLYPYSDLLRRSAIKIINYDFIK